MMNFNHIKITLTTIPQPFIQTYYMNIFSLFLVRKIAYNNYFYCKILWTALLQILLHKILNCHSLLYKGSSFLLKVFSLVLFFNVMILWHQTLQKKPSYKLPLVELSLHLRGENMPDLLLSFVTNWGLCVPDCYLEHNAIFRLSKSWDYF